MTVWVVLGETYWPEDGGQQVLGIYATEEDARRGLEGFKAQHGNTGYYKGYTYDIESYPVLVWGGTE